MIIADFSKIYKTDPRIGPFFSRRQTKGNIYLLIRILHIKLLSNDLRSGLATAPEELELGACRINCVIMIHNRHYKRVIDRGSLTHNLIMPTLIRSPFLRH